MNSQDQKRNRPTSSRSLVEDTSGAVYVEFILSFIPLLLLFLGIVQMGMLYSAALVVQHAAVTATRAAAVVLDDNPSRYDGQTRLTVTGTESGGAPEEGILGDIFGSGSGGTSIGAGGSGSARTSAIRYAAMVPLMTVTPPPEAFFPMGRRASLATDIGFNAPESRAAMALWYSRGMMNVTFPREVRGSSFRDRWNRPDSNGNSGTVTSRVTFLYMCGVPIVNRMMCEDGLSLMAGNGAPALAESIAIYSKDGRIDSHELSELSSQRDRSSGHFDRWSDEMAELEDGPGFGMAVVLYGITFAGMGGGARFRPLQAEATLPVQAANYCYRGSSGNCWRQR